MRLSMPFLDGDVVVKEINEKQWRLLHPLVYRLYRQTYVVPTHFKTDFATVPRVFAWLVPPYGKYTKAAILHDFLCRAKRVNRSKADMIFRRAMRELGVSFLRRWLMWAAVRAGGRLKDTHPREAILWLLITIPALFFLAIPAVVILIWLTLYWIAEYIVFGVFKPFRREPNKPNFLLGTDAFDKKN